MEILANWSIFEPEYIDLSNEPSGLYLLHYREKTYKIVKR